MAGSVSELCDQGRANENPGIVGFTRLATAKHISGECLYQVYTFSISAINVNSLQGHPLMGENITEECNW